MLYDKTLPKADYLTVLLSNNETFKNLHIITIARVGTLKESSSED